MILGASVEDVAVARYAFWAAAMPTIAIVLHFVFNRLFAAKSDHQMEIRMADSRRALDENTEISRKAFTEANSFNQKIIEVTTRVDEMGGRVSNIERDITRLVDTLGSLCPMMVRKDGEANLQCDSLSKRIDLLEQRIQGGQ